MNTLQRANFQLLNEWLIANVFCSTGAGGGVDPTCGKEGGGVSAPKADLKSDMRRQAEWLSEKAKAHGFASVDEMVEKDPALFAKLGHEWRKPKEFAALKRIGTGKESKWVQSDGKELPEHIKGAKIPPGWTDVKVNPDERGDLVATGTDSKGRMQRVYSEAHTKRQAAEKFARNKELIDKQESVFKQNDDNLKHDDKSVRENAAVMKLIQTTGIRPGSDVDTKAEQKAHGATTLEGRHVKVMGDGSVRLQFVGKKGVSLDIPVEDKATAAILVERKRAVGSSEKLFSTDASSLRDYSHKLDGGAFKPKDFRTLKGTQTAMAEVEKAPERAKTLKEYKARVLSVAKKVAEKLGNTPTIALQSYINPFVFEQWKPE